MIERYNKTGGLARSLKQTALKSFPGETSTPRKFQRDLYGLSHLQQLLYLMRLTIRGLSHLLSQFLSLSSCQLSLQEIERFN